MSSEPKVVHEMFSEQGEFGDFHDFVHGHTLIPTTRKMLMRVEAELARLAGEEEKHRKQVRDVINECDRQVEEAEAECGQNSLPCKPRLPGCGRRWKT
jgi:hypothetical protein